MPTHNHEILKLKAIEWLYQVKKCKWVACELKFGSYIYDVVGTDGFRIYVVEAKRSYNDFKKDCNNPEDIKKNVEEYKRLLKETCDAEYKEKIKQERGKSIKFYDDAIFKLANECYVIAPDDLIPGEEIPEGWGLLNEEPMTVVEAIKRAVDKKWITRIIGEIAKKHTKMYLRSIGVEFRGRKTIFPETFLLDEDKEIEKEEDNDESADTDS